MSTVKLAISLVDTIFSIWDDKNKVKYKERYLKLIQAREDALNEIPQDHNLIDELGLDIVRFARIFSAEIRAKESKDTRN